MSEHVLLVFIRLVHTNSFSIWHDLFWSQSKGELLKRWHTFTSSFWLPWADVTSNRHERRTCSLGKCRQPITRLISTSKTYCAIAQAWIEYLYMQMRYTSCQNITPAEIRIFIGRKKACDHERDRVYMSKSCDWFQPIKTLTSCWRWYYHCNGLLNN